MKPSPVIALLCLLAAGLRAEEFDRIEIELGAGESAAAPVLDLGLVEPQPSGPGFRSFYRFAIGGSFASSPGPGQPFEDLTESSSTVVYYPVSIPFDYFVGFRDYSTSLFALDDSINLGATDDDLGVGGSASDVIDDILANGMTVFIVDVNDDGIYNPFDDLIYYEFGGLTTVNVRFDNLRTIDSQSVRSLEVVGQHLWTRRDGVLNSIPAWRVNGHGPLGLLEAGRVPEADIGPRDLSRRLDDGGWFRGYQAVNYLAYGLRLSDGRDRYLLDGDTDFFGRVIVDTTTHHYSIGPSFALGRVIAKGPWRTDVSGHVMLGYAHSATEQHHAIGVTATPSEQDNTVAAQPFRGEEQRHTSHLAQHAELRVTTSYQIRPNVTIDATFRGFLTGPWYHSSELLHLSFEDMGIQSTDSTAYAGYNAYVGMTYLR